MQINRVVDIFNFTFDGELDHTSPLHSAIIQEAWKASVGGGPYDAEIAMKQLANNRERFAYALTVEAERGYEGDE